VNDITNDDGTIPEPNSGTRQEPTVEIPSHEQEMVRLREERDQLEQQLQRQLADAANVRRRQQKEMEDQKRRVLEGLTQELLPALDTFGMALSAFDAGSGDPAGSDPKALIEGVRMTRMLLTSALERHGLAEIKAEGQTFDPLRHEAVATEAAAAVPPGRILRVLQAGYMLGDRVVRHSRVVVAGPAANSPS
jgi:molecular chaperone GrpE